MNRRLEVIVARRGGWFTRRDASAAGYSASEVQRRVRSGQWRRMSYNAYVEPSSDPTDETPWDRALRLYRLSIRMAFERLADVVVSHQSAAALHGLPLWGTDLSKVHFTRSVTGRDRTGRTLRIHRSPVEDDEVVVVDGLPVTSVERAILETTCTTSYEVGVVLSDAALRLGSTTREQLAACVERHRHWPGSPAARAAVQFADGLSESVGESRLRVLMANHELPPPELQVEIRDDDGDLIGRVDFLLRRHSIVEFDGAIKYGEGTPAVLAEKRREDRLRAAGYGLARVDWTDLDHPQQTARHLHKNLRQHELTIAHRSSNALHLRQT
ncbi:type IV toxin-antitoxin system AbiEi family antitoxin domain-containing protein [Kribbella sp. NPDC048915]|uniref:type IV toxin-antitoxin system AbiEi family antitoxin domain-containing protein n=1 Tax=Kribbella sp. NPDC048915 TaxID=3155148 RepID=UPI0033D1A976